MSQCDIYTVTKEQYEISTDQALLDLDVIHGYLTRSYWSPGIPKEKVALAIENSLCFGLYDRAENARTLVGFARVVTDRASFAYLADVFILPTYQGQGLGTWMMAVLMDCPDIAGIRSFFLATRDAHGLYAKFGFEIPANPDRLMMKRYEIPWYDPSLATA